MPQVASRCFESGPSSSLRMSRFSISGMSCPLVLTCSLFFFFNDTATTEIYTLSLHDALPIFYFFPFIIHHSAFIILLSLAFGGRARLFAECGGLRALGLLGHASEGEAERAGRRDRKSTRLNSSHDQISYAVFCLKKKKKTGLRPRSRRTPSANRRRRREGTARLCPWHGTPPARRPLLRITGIRECSGHVPPVVLCVVVPSITPDGSSMH